MTCIFYSFGLLNQTPFSDFLNVDNTQRAAIAQAFSGFSKRIFPVHYILCTSTFSGCVWQPFLLGSFCVSPSLETLSSLPAIYYGGVANAIVLVTQDVGFYSPPLSFVQTVPPPVAI